MPLYKYKKTKTSKRIGGGTRTVKKLTQLGRPKNTWKEVTTPRKTKTVSKYKGKKTVTKTSMLKNPRGSGKKIGRQLGKILKDKAKNNSKK